MDRLTYTDVFSLALTVALTTQCPWTSGSKREVVVLQRLKQNMMRGTRLTEWQTVRVMEDFG